VRPGGHIIVIVPHRDLYEKKIAMPSRFSGEHVRFYTSASLLNEIEMALPYNSVRIEHLWENDTGHDYSQSDEEHSIGLYEIELVLRKIKK
jgi:hypothetical protein